ncbi:MAG: asparagine synthase (glutamine-hydrolyzing) [Epsilonproteobacteria bacterium]|nr:asparagine synthase (glutamine-hydrolyzing) [Campylobacterota bacterium]NPA56477.1 asparagine synthase (glutamine-hydrolyzing) [Campylobacterota bacterium]
MCGIFGIVGRYDEERALKAAETLAHRGPDQRGISKGENIFLAHQRLAILDQTASQPMEREGILLAFNGEIYNYSHFDSPNEGETILKLYSLMGEEFPRYLEGTFAIALWEGGRLLLISDPLGKKPLYYTERGGDLIFASEIKGILAYTGGAPFNERALSGYLSFGSLPNGETFYSGIFRLPARSLLIYQGGKLSLKRYTTLLEREEGDLQELIERSVEKRLQGDHPVAALLSGGIDSSLVSAIAKRRQGELTTYSIGYREGRYSELPYARTVAHHIGSHHKEIILDREMFLEGFERILDHFDEPIGDSASIPLWFLMEEIGRDGFKVVLGGEGGDELFLGYRYYFEMAELLKAREFKYKGWLRNYFRSHFSPNREWEWYKRIWNDEPLFRGSCEVFTDLQKNLLSNRPISDGESLTYLEELFQEWEEAQWENPYDLFTFIDLKVRQEFLYLHRLDMVGMAHSVEARTPLLDRSLLRAVFASPDRAAEPKGLLKRVAAPYLPPQIINRKKRGFSYPHMEWLKKSDYLDKIAKINGATGFFRPERLHFLIEGGKRNRFSRHLWVVLSFLLWYERRF